MPLNPYFVCCVLCIGLNTKMDIAQKTCAICRLGHIDEHAHGDWKKADNLDIHLFCLVREMPREMRENILREFFHFSVAVNRFAAKRCCWWSYWHNLRLSIEGYSRLHKVTLQEKMPLLQEKVRICKVCSKELSNLVARILWLWEQMFADIRRWISFILQKTCRNQGRIRDSWGFLAMPDV